MTRSMRSQIVQNVEMPIGGGTTDSSSEGKVLRSLERIAQQPLEQPYVHIFELTQQFM